MMSGEYFLTKDEINQKAQEKKRDQRDAKKQEKVEAQHKLFEAPAEDLPQREKQNKRQKKAEEKALAAVVKDEGAAAPKKYENKKPDVNDLKNKFLKKK